MTAIEEWQSVSEVDREFVLFALVRSGLANAALVKDAESAALDMAAEELRRHTRLIGCAVHVLRNAAHVTTDAKP